jgi:hypothetical protein
MVVELSCVEVVVMFEWVALLRRWAARTVKLGTSPERLQMGCTMSRLTASESSCSRLQSKETRFIGEGAECREVSLLQCNHLHHFRRNPARNHQP